MKDIVVKEPVADQIPVVRNEIQIACFRVGDGLFALDILRIKEVIRPQKLTVVPKAPGFVEGVLNLRGTIIPVVDLLRRFTGQPHVPGRKTRVIICALRGNLFGLIVDEVLEVRLFQRQDVLPAPDFLDESTAILFSGVCRRDQELILILNLDRVFSTKEHQQLDQIQIHPSTSP